MGHRTGEGGENLTEEIQQMVVVPLPVGARTYLRVSLPSSILRCVHQNWRRCRNFGTPRFPS